MARWTTAREVEGEADLTSRVDSPIFSPEKERSGRVASLQEMESELECEIEFEFGVNFNLGIELEMKIEEEKKEREVEVGVSVEESEAILFFFWVQREKFESFALSTSFLSYLFKID